MFTATITDDAQPGSAPAVDRTCDTWEQAAAHLFAALTTALGNADGDQVAITFNGSGLTVEFSDTTWSMDITGGQPGHTLLDEAPAHLIAHPH